MLSPRIESRNALKWCRERKTGSYHKLGISYIKKIVLSLNVDQFVWE